MKIAIITWCSYHNFGTYLQAYAIQWQLKKMGHEAMLLDDSTYTTDIVRTKKFQCIIFCKRIVKELLPSYRKTLKNDKIALRLYQNFRNKYLDIDKYIEPLSSLDKRYDCYVCGSDQIWNAECLKTTGKDFFFANFSQKLKIAYAPSGLANYPSSARLELANLTARFDYLSVREITAASMLHNLTGKNVVTVLDPTLLVSQKEWEKLIPVEEKPVRPYILLYLLKQNRIYIQTAKQYAHHKGVALKIVHSMYVNHLGHTIPAGPSEFLALVKNAEMVMTDSFHGTIFAITFQRPFVTFQRFHTNEDNNSQNLRLVNLFNMIGFSNRYIDETQVGMIYNLGSIDFQIIHKRLEPYIETSKAYLVNALSRVCHE